MVFKEGIYSVVFKERVWYLKWECGFSSGSVVFKEGVWYLKWACGI